MATVAERDNAFCTRLAGRSWQRGMAVDPVDSDLLTWPPSGPLERQNRAAGLVIIFGRFGLTGGMRIGIARLLLRFAVSRETNASEIAMGPCQEV